MVSSLGARRLSIPFCVDAKGCLARAKCRKYFCVERKSARTWLISLIVLIGFVSGCGGGSSSTTPSPAQIAVSVSPSSASVLLGTTKQFMASVSGTTNTAVNWSVNGIAGGNSTTGSIDANGLYMAPADLPRTRRRER
jgi:hypothetical protein